MKTCDTCSHWTDEAPYAQPERFTVRVCGNEKLSEEDKMLITQTMQMGAHVTFTVDKVSEGDKKLSLKLIQRHKSL